jgi:hypothetical protein
MLFHSSDRIYLSPLLIFDADTGLFSRSLLFVIESRITHGPRFFQDLRAGSHPCADHERGGGSPTHGAKRARLTVKHVKHTTGGLHGTEAETRVPRGEIYPAAAFEVCLSLPIDLDTWIAWNPATWWQLE